MLISEIKPEDTENFINLIKKIETEVMKVDAFGFGKAFHRKYTKEWETCFDHRIKMEPCC
ncbi:Ger(x)C family spore germination C-terminal domain-containing protein [Bacillus salipaludis]|uniref:Ger(x)C family spore germination C-terminal domain-containing protein n=1 Tax=Bacillus salipaludis TaxID=2547811 RepID=UPI003D24297F